MSMNCSIAAEVGHEFGCKNCFTTSKLISISTMKSLFKSPLQIQQIAFIHFTAN